MEQLKAWIRGVGAGLCEQDALKAIFEHTRNIIVATLVIAAGSAALHSGPKDRRFLYPATAGYLLATIGVVLLVLNFADGFYRLRNLRFHRSLRFLLLLLHLVLAFRRHDPRTSGQSTSSR